MSWILIGLLASIPFVVLWVFLGWRHKKKLSLPKEVLEQAAEETK